MKELFERRSRVTVIGGASIDTLHLREGAMTVAGGAGLYTALAARRSGSQVTMIAPRPAPMPPELSAVDDRIDWRGPQVPPEGLPRFDIAYSEGGERRLRIDNAGSEPELDPERVVPELAAGPVYVIPLMDSRRQLDFARVLKAHGRWVGCGTYPCGVRDDPETVRAIVRTADAFFCNEEEAEALFGSLDDASTEAGKLLFVTRGRRGVSVMQGSHATEVRAVPANEIDPTGAGDALCGGVLAALAAGLHPVEAARQGAAVAAELVSDVGPRALCVDRPAPQYPTDPRIELDGERITRVAEWLGDASSAAGFDFTGGPFPETGHPAALDYFFAQTLQQFGFWRAEDGKYVDPMIASVGGERRKGSDYMWFVHRRLLEEDAAALTPARQRDLERCELDSWYQSDAGSNPVPAADLHWQLARRYGSDLQAQSLDPRDILTQANRSSRPVAAFLRFLDHVGGYKEDPLRKKSALLALVLRQRPEQFLRRMPGEEVPPIVDYHIQRSCLRMGLVEVTDIELRQRLEDRRVVEGEDEDGVRRACYRAVEKVRRRSGRSMAAVDWFFFQNRRRCPEMSEPQCRSCEVETVCAQRKSLFQPVRRTTFY